MWSLSHAVRCLHDLFFEDPEVALRELACIGAQFISLNVAVVEVHNGDMLWHLYHLVIDGFVEYLGLDADQERERGIYHVNHVDRQDRDQGVVPAERED